MSREVIGTDVPINPFVYVTEAEDIREEQGIDVVTKVDQLREANQQSSFEDSVSTLLIKLSLFPYCWYTLVGMQIGHL